MGLILMTSFHFDIGSRARNAGRFIGRVQSELLRALAEKKMLRKFSQQSLARKLQVHRSLINRQLSGEANLTLRSLADLAWALDMEITIELKDPVVEAGSNQTFTTSTIQHAPIKIINGGRKLKSRLPANSDRQEMPNSQAKSA
jgi:transcriptional regulator with XRE-family HTH domain